MFPRSVKCIITTGILAALALGSCRKKYTCSASYFYFDESVAFGGFQPAELQQIVLRQYQAGSHFSILVSTDTIDGSNAQYRGDTAYLVSGNPLYKGFFPVGEAREYIIQAPAAQREYTISLKRGESGKTWEQSEACEWKQTVSSNLPFLITINGQELLAYAPYPNNYFICLRR